MHLYKKTGIAFISAIIVGVIVSGSFAANAATNFVANGDLETGTTAPTSWTQGSWGTINAVYTYPVTGNGSAKAAQVKVMSRSSGDAKWMFDHVAVTPGTTYTFNEDYSSSVDTEIDIEYKMNDGSYSYSWLTDVASSANTWKNYVGQITPPAGAVSMSVIHIIEAVGTLTIDNISVSTGTSTTPLPPIAPTISSFTATPSSITAGQNSTLAWNVSNATSLAMSDGVTQTAVTGTSKAVSLTATTTYTLTAYNGGTATTSKQVTIHVTMAQATSTPPATTTPPTPPATTTPPTSANLITNGNFEGGSTAPTAWNKDYWGAMTPTFTYPVAGKSGGKAVKVAVANWKSGDAKWWFNHVPVSSNTVYHFTDDYIATAVTNVTVEYKMSNGTYQYQWVANAPVASTWTPLSVQITVPTGAISMTVLHSLTSNGTLSIDNASLVALPSNPFPTGMVSFVFDDGLLSQYTSARPILATAGFKGVYGIITQGVRDISGDPASMTWAQITTLKNAGNEIAAHTRTHPDLTKLTNAQAQTEITGSRNELTAKGFNPKSFVYPLGAVSPSIEVLVKNAGFTAARGSYWGMNTPTANKFALYDIRMDKTTTIAQAKAYIDQAFTDKRWLILELHDVLAAGGDDFAVTPAFLQQVVDYVKQKGIKVVTLQEGRALTQ